MTDMNETSVIGALLFHLLLLYGAYSCGGHVGKKEGLEEGKKEYVAERIYEDSNLPPGITGVILVIENSLSKKLYFRRDKDGNYLAATKEIEEFQRILVDQQKNQVEMKNIEEMLRKE